MLSRKSVESARKSLHKSSAMLQTRRSLRPLSAAVLLTVLYCTCLRAADAQPARTCTNAATSFGQDGKTKAEIYDQLKDETALNGVCKLDKTCCSKKAEFMFKQATASDYREHIQSGLASALMPCHNNSVLMDIVKFIQDSKENLVSVMRRQFSIYFNPYVHIFDEFYEYLESSVWTGDVCQLKERFTKVSFEMFLAAYIVTTQSQPGLNSELPDTTEFRSCFFDYFVELRGDAIYNKLNGFLRAYNLTMRYIRALRLLDSVIEEVMDMTLTSQCQDAIMKMTHCSQCAGYNGNLLPCRGLCLNSLRGCLVDLVDLVEPVKEFTAAIVNLNKLMNDTFNPWDQITLLNSYFFQTVSYTRLEITNINQNLFLRCNANGPRQRRSISDDEERSAPLSPSRPQESVERERERRFVVARAAPTPPYAALNFSSHCVYDTLSIFTSLPGKMCDQTAIGKGNSNCWTGVSFGSYERTVLDLNRSSQKDNPELVVCTRKSRADMQIAQLQFMTRELNILTGAQECSDDDEDCADTVPDTCQYYEFPDSFELISDEVGSGSGSGEGEEEEDFVLVSQEDDSDVCASLASVVSIPNVDVEPETTTLSTDSGAVKLSSVNSLLTLFLVLVSLVASTSCRSYL